MAGPTTGDSPAPDGQCAHGVHQVLDRETDPGGTVRERRRYPLRCGAERVERVADVPRARAAVGDAWDVSGAASALLLPVRADGGGADAHRGGCDADA